MLHPIGGGGRWETVSIGVCDTKGYEFLKHFGLNMQGMFNAPRTGIRYSGTSPYEYLYNMDTFILRTLSSLYLRCPY